MLLSIPAYRRQVARLESVDPLAQAENGVDIGLEMIISENINGVVVDTKTLPGGTELKGIGDHGYDEICRRLTAEESDEQRCEFRAGIDRDVTFQVGLVLSP